MTSRAAVLIVGSIALATTSVFAARWDPPFVDAPQEPQEVPVPSDLRLPVVDEFLPWGPSPQSLRAAHRITLDLHALTIDGREVATVPAETTPMLLPGDVLLPPGPREARPGMALLFVDAHVPFAVARTLLRGLSEPPQTISVVVEKADGTRGFIELLESGGFGKSNHVVRVRRGSVTVDGRTIPALPSGAVDVATLRRTFRPLRSPLIVPDEDAPFGDVMSVIAPYAVSEFTDPVLAIWPAEWGVDVIDPLGRDPMMRDAPWVAPRRPAHVPPPRNQDGKEAGIRPSPRTKSP